MTKPYISSGNSKMPSIPTFSLPAGSTCPGCTPSCLAHCYARKAERAYPQVLPSRRHNLEASRQPDFVDLVSADILESAPDFFRIHESGDFYNQYYLDKWLEIARRCPRTRFLAFTKSFHLDFSRCPENLEIVWSVWTDTDLSRVPKAGRRAYAGSCSVPATAIECPGYCDTCGLCWHLSKIGQDVHFKIH